MCIQFHCDTMNHHNGLHPHTHPHSHYKAPSTCFPGSRDINLVPSRDSSI